MTGMYLSTQVLVQLTVHDTTEAVFKQYALLLIYIYMYIALTSRISNSFSLMSKRYFNDIIGLNEP